MKIYMMTDLEGPAMIGTFDQTRDVTPEEKRRSEYFLTGEVNACVDGILDFDPEADFAHNALVFAPGKTILEALRELAEVPYDRILPPRLYKHFAASVKLTFTRSGETDIPVICGSSFNLLVTNTEKIRITAEALRRPIRAGAL